MNAPARHISALPSRRAKPAASPTAAGEASVPSREKDRAADRDSYSVTAFSDVMDRSLTAALARLTGGLSPAGLALAYWDWAMHLAFSPGKRMQLVDKAVRKSARLANYGLLK